MLKRLFTILCALFAVASLPAIPTKADTLQVGDTSHPVCLLEISSSDHLTGLTGATVTVTISKNGAAYASPVGTIAEISNGLYKFTPTSADDGTLGQLWIHATATGADPLDKEVDIVSWNPFTAGSGTLLQYGAGTGQLTPDGSGNALISSGTGSGQISLSSGKVLLQATQTGVTIPTVTNVTNAVTISGTPSVNVTQIAGQTASASAGVTFPTSIGTSTYAGGAVASVTGNVGGNVVGSVGSVTGAVASVTAGVTVTTNNDKTGYALTTGQNVATVGGLAPPTNWNLAAIDGTGKVTLTTSEHTAISGTDVPSALTAQGYNSSLATALGVTNTSLSNLLQGSGGTQKFTATALSLAPTGGSAPTTSQIAAAILATPSNLLATNGSGQVTYSNTAPPTAAQNVSALMNYSVGHSLTFGQLMVLLQAAPGLISGVTNTWNASTHILSTAYQFSGDGSAILTTNTQYPTSQVTNPAISTRTTTTGTIPQP